MPYVEDYLPLIVPRIEFLPAPPSPLPLITLRTEFTPELVTFMENERSRIAEGDGATGRSDQHDRNEPSAQPLSRGRNRPEQSTTNRSQKIPKPPGQPGRRSGGYNTEDELINRHKWKKEDVEGLKTAVRAMAKEHLDTSRSFRAQSKTKIQNICNQMTDNNHWPLLKNYEDCWPVVSILKLTLKYNAEATKRSNMKALSSRLQAAMRGESPDEMDAD